jgi:hypothetical protein
VIINMRSSPKFHCSLALPNAKAAAIKRSVNETTVGESGSPDFTVRYCAPSLFLSQWLTPLAHHFPPSPLELMPRTSSSRTAATLPDTQHRKCLLQSAGGLASLLGTNTHQFLPFTTICPQPLRRRQYPPIVLEIYRVRPALLL